MERPRARKAKDTGENLAPDEFIENLELDYDAKRDRWNGYSGEDYRRDVVDVHESREQVRQLKREKALAEKNVRKRLKASKAGVAEKKSAETSESSSESSSDEEESGEGGVKQTGLETAGTGGVKPAKPKTTTRNLRIREDTAKYLVNLDVNSAYYCPKSRSMRENPRAGLPEEEQRT